MNGPSKSCSFRRSAGRLRWHGSFYEENEASREKRALEVEKRRRFNEPASTLKGRPTKRDRRDLERFQDPD